MIGKLSKICGQLALSLVFIMVSGNLAAQEDALKIYREGDYQAAVTLTLKEIEADKTNLDSYSVLGWSLNNLKRYNEAITYAKQAYQVNKADHRILGILAEAHLGLKQDLPALEYFQRFISVGLNLSGWDTRYLRDAYRDMGEIFIRLGEFHKADLAFSAAIAYDKGRSAYDAVRSGRLWARLGYARELSRDIAASVEAYRIALQKDTANEDAKSGMARIKPGT